MAMALVSRFVGLVDGINITSMQSTNAYTASGEVKVTYLDKPYELSVSLHQMTLVLLFNTVQILSIKDIAAQTGLNVPEVLRSVKVKDRTAALLYVTASGFV
jgi:hypothetical protein